MLYFFETCIQAAETIELLDDDDEGAENHNNNSGGGGGGGGGPSGHAACAPRGPVRVKAEAA